MFNVFLPTIDEWAAPSSSNIANSKMYQFFSTQDANVVQWQIKCVFRMVRNEVISIMAYTSILTPTFKYKNETLSKKYSLYFVMVENSSYVRRFSIGELWQKLSFSIFKSFTYKSAILFHRILPDNSIRYIYKRNVRNIPYSRLNNIL